MKKLRVLLSLHTQENDFQVAQAASAQQTARQLNMDLEIVYADNDAVNQSTQILKALQRDAAARPDAVILEPISSIALPQAAQAACKAGIAWVLLNRHPEYLAGLRRTTKVPIFAVSSDHVEIGRLQGKQFAALLPRGGWILYVEGPSQGGSAQQRTMGMMETKPTNLQVTTLRGQWTEQSSQRAVRSWLKLATSRTAAIDLVGAQDDSMAMGARRAFEEITDKSERDRWLRLPFTGCDGMPETGQAWVREGLLAATIYIPPNSGQAMQILAKAIESGTQPPEQALTECHSIPLLEELKTRKE
jgi:ribose transport system substrate-binding protein